MQVTLRPVTCTSPTTMDRPEPGKRDQNQQQYQQSVAAGSITACLYNEPSAAIVLADGSASSASHVGLMSSSSFAGVLRAEPSSASAMLAAEASKLSAVGAAALEGIEGPKRSDALPAARRMVLERQVRSAFLLQHQARCNQRRLHLQKLPAHLTWEAVNSPCTPVQCIMVQAIIVQEAGRPGVQQGHNNCCAPFCRQHTVQQLCASLLLLLV